MINDLQQPLNTPSSNQTRPMIHAETPQSNNTLIQQEAIRNQYQILGEAGRNQTRSQHEADRNQGIQHRTTSNARPNTSENQRQMTHRLTSSSQSSTRSPSQINRNSTQQKRQQFDNITQTFRWKQQR